MVDGLDDYDDDFTAFEALGDLVTADMRHERAREAERLAEERAEADEEETSPEAPATVAEAEEPGAPQDAAGEGPEAQDEDGDEDEDGDAEEDPRA